MVDTGLAYRRMAEKHGMTQTKVALICGVHGNTAHRWFHDTDQLLVTMERNCERLGWEKWEFLDYAIEGANRKQKTKTDPIKKIKSDVTALRVAANRIESDHNLVAQTLRLMADDWENSLNVK